MVTTIIKYIGESLKVTIPFLDEVHAPVRRLITGVIYKGDSNEKQPISINDAEGKALYIRQTAIEQVSEGPPRSSCGKNYIINAKCRLVFYSFSNNELSPDKIKSVLSNELAKVNFKQFKGSSSNIKISNNSYSDDFEMIFTQETGKTYGGDEWPIIIAIDFALNYEDSNCEPCDIGPDEYSPVIMPPNVEQCEKIPFCEAVEGCEVIKDLQQQTASLQEQIDAALTCDNLPDCEIITNILQSINDIISSLPSSYFTCASLAGCQTIIDIMASIVGLQQGLASTDENITILTTDLGNLITLVDGLTLSLNNHIGDINNPHQTTLEQARTADNFFSGEVDMNSNRLRNLPVPLNADEAVNKSYVDGLVDNTLKAAEGYNPTITSLFPTTYGGDPIEKGDTFRILASGVVNGINVDAEDLLIADVDTPGQTTTNWQILESNREQATETVKGVAKIATQATIEDELTSNNTDIVTPQKFWFGLLRFLKLAWTWDLKQTFTTAPRFSSTNASQYLKVDASKDLTSVGAIPATDITEDTTHRFATDSEKTTWNAKEPAIAAGTTSQYWRGDKSWQSLGSAILGQVLTGLSLATSQTIAATDTVLLAFGYIQAQITANTTAIGTKLTSPSLTDYSATSTIVGFTSFTSKSIYVVSFPLWDDIIVILEGPSSASTGLSFTLPNTAGLIVTTNPYILNNGNAVTGRLNMPGGSATVSCSASVTGAAFTAAGTKGVRAQFRVWK